MRESLYAQQPASLIWRRRVVVFGMFGSTVAAIVVVTAATLGGSGGSARMSLESLRGSPVRVGSAGHLVQPVDRRPGRRAGRSGRCSCSAGSTRPGAGQRDPAVRRGERGVVGHLPSGLPGAGAAELGGTVYVFGGGAGQPSQAIFEVSELSGGAVRQVARLPRAVAGAAVAAVGGTAFVVGGCDGATRARRDPRLAAGRRGPPDRPPAGPLEFAAAASVGGKVIIAGGLSGGVASRDILRFDPATAPGHADRPAPGAAGPRRGGDARGAWSS